MDKVVELFSKKIVDWLATHNRIGPEKEELYTYSALIAIQSVINILATLLLGLIFDVFFENICFFVVFKILREYSGGLHSSKFSTCFLISIVSNVAIIIAIKMFEVYPNYYLVIITEVVSFLIIIIFTPITNKNKSITKTERRIYKIIVCVVCVVVIGGTIILCAKESSFAFSICLAMLLNSALVVVEILKNKKLIKE